MMSCNTLDIYCDQKEVSRLNLRLAPRGVPSPLRPIIFERKALKFSPLIDMTWMHFCRAETEKYGKGWGKQKNTSWNKTKQKKIEIEKRLFSLCLAWQRFEKEEQGSWDPLQW